MVMLFAISFQLMQSISSCCPEGDLTELLESQEIDEKEKEELPYMHGFHVVLNDVNEESSLFSRDRDCLHYTTVYREIPLPPPELS